MARSKVLGDIPHPPYRPGVGHLLTVDTKRTVSHLNEIAQDYGPTFGLDVRGVPLLFVSDFDGLDEISDESRFSKTVRGPLKRIRRFGGDGLFTADSDDPHWQAGHNVLLNAFNGKAMRDYHEIMVDVAEEMVTKWERLNPDEDFDVVHQTTGLALDTIGLCGFDYRFNSFYRDDFHPFVEALGSSLETTMLIQGLPHEKLTLRKKLSALERDTQFMFGIVDAIVADRKERGFQPDHVDLLSTMMTIADKDTGSMLEDEHMRFQIITFLIAGHETTSALLSFTLWVMMKHPEILERVRAEVDEVYGNTARPTYQQVTQLTYTTQLLKEVLRLWPPAPTFGVTPLRDDTITGLPVKKGTMINVLIGSCHRDEKIWEDPERIDPGRFAPELERERPINAWKPFGNGKRSCIGRAFAMHEAANTLAMILQRFDLVDHRDYQMKFREQLTIKPLDFRIQVRPRADRTAPLTHTAPAPAPVATRPMTPGPEERAKRQLREMPQHGTSLRVLFGSELGQSEQFARQVADDADVAGFAVELGGVDDHFDALVNAETPVVIVTSSYNGAPPENVVRFYEWLGQDHPADSLQGLRYAVFGCGNRDWHATYQAVPTFIDERMAALGATRVCARGEGDARGDIDSEFAEWLDVLRPTAVKTAGVKPLDRVLKPGPLLSVETLPDAAPHPVADAAGSVTAVVTENRELQTHGGAPGERSTRHLEIALPEGVTWEPGDHLSILPTNDPVLVDRLARRFGHKVTDRIVIEAAPGRRTLLPTGTELVVGHLLSELVELREPATRRQIEIMAAHTQCPRTRAVFEGWLDDHDRYEREVFRAHLSVPDLLQRHPACELPFATFLEFIPPMAARFYSISSSPRRDPRHASVTVGMVEGLDAEGAAYTGVASGYLAERAVGDTVRAAIHHTKRGFRLPSDTTRPIIMVGPGTGLAPFRGFLQERDERQKAGAELGPAILYFGARNPDVDALYADELADFDARGVASVRTAWSRVADRRYVQDLMREHAEELWGLIENDAVIYVCGDSSSMEPDVKRTLTEIWSQHTGGDAAAADEWITQLGRDNRYVLDVWAGRR